MALTLSGSTGITGAGIGTIGPSGANITGIVTATSISNISSINSGQIGGRRNLVINGAMRLAQRSSSAVATSNSSNEGYQTIDRMHFNYGNNAAGAANISQSTDVPSGLGFSESHKTDVTTTNTTSGGTGTIQLGYFFESQDIRNSGWNYTSSSSYITISFYFKTNVSGTKKLPIMLRSRGSTNQYYVKDITVTGTDWARYSLTIPGNSNIVFDNDTSRGLEINFVYYAGSDKNVSSEGAWGSTNAYNTSNSTNFFDNTSNDMYVTGLQVEIGDTVTDFEHRSYGEELSLCERYYEVLVDGANGNSGNGDNYLSVGAYFNSSSVYTAVRFRQQKRAIPTIKQSTGTDYWSSWRDGANDAFDAWAGTSWPGTENIMVYANTGISGTAGQASLMGADHASAWLAMDAEI